MKRQHVSIIAALPLLLTNSCSTPVSADVVRSVDSAVSMGYQFRHNPDNEGGNENVVYEPSSYPFGRLPIWMSDPTMAHKCLILIIAKDKDFNESNWISFYHGIRRSDIPIVKDRVFKVGPHEYSRLSNAYFGDSGISYEVFRSKIESFEKIPLETMRNEDADQAAP